MKIGPYYMTEWIAGLCGLGYITIACLFLLAAASDSESSDLYAVAALGGLLAAFVSFKFFVPSDTVRHIRDGRSDLLPRKAPADN
jgi:hypothetical protein